MKSRVVIPLDGSTRLFTVPFPFLNQTHVQFLVNRTLQLVPLNFSWVGDSTVEFSTPPSGILEIRRQTPADVALVNFRNGAQLTEDELNLAVLQNLFVAQEIRDYYDALIDGSLDRLVSGGSATPGIVIDNVVQTILDSELLAELRQQITDIEENANTINAQRIRLDTVEEIVDSLANIDGQSVATFLQNEQLQRIEGDTALAQSLALIGAKSGDGLSWLIDLAKVKVSGTESLGQRLTALQSSIAANAATIATEQTTRATQDSALATQISNVNTRVGNAETLITQEQTARSTADTALGNSIAGLTAQVNDNRTLILTEQSVRAAADSAQASSISTLQTAVAGNTASISTQQSVINGLAAQYSVKLDVNGYVSGFGLYNSGGTSSFTILADRFSLVTPGSTPVVPFAVDASGVYMNNAYIRNLSVDKITGGAITAQWNLNSTSGRIVLDTGTHMKVLGVGFGANGDLVEWYGPKMAIGACTKTNAITYVGTNGDAYFGGSLRAGTLYSARQSTNTQVPNDCPLGPLATNGNPKSIVVSYAFSTGYLQTKFGAGGFTVSGPCYADLELYRKIGSGSFVLVYTTRLEGAYLVENEFDGPDRWSARISGSFTFTDSFPGTDSREYIARIAARALPSVSHSEPSPTFTAANTTQNLSIVSTEE